MGSQFIQNGEQKVVYPRAPAVLMLGVLVGSSLGDLSGLRDLGPAALVATLPPFQPQVSLGLERCPVQKRMRLERPQLCKMSSSLLW